MFYPSCASVLGRVAKRHRLLSKKKVASRVSRVLPQVEAPSKDELLSSLQARDLVKSVVDLHVACYFQVPQASLRDNI